MPASTGLTPTSNPASNARTRCWPICSGVLSLAASSVAASSVMTSSGVDASSSEHLQHPVDVVALPVTQPAELEHRRAVADLLHLRTPEVVLELRMADEHHRELAAALRDQLDQALQGDQRFRVKVVRVIDEQRYRLLGLPEQFLKVALAPLRLAGDGNGLLGAQSRRTARREQRHRDLRLFDRQRRARR